ncbi:MAG: RNA methyltransferase [Paludibacteraceae bacterium]|nr:RNA methyltransferase [Paludibacteraceae bacterium]
MIQITKAQVKLVRSLQQKKYRDETGLFVAEGDKCINELRNAFQLEIMVTEENATRSEIEQMSSLRTPQGSIAVFKKRQDNGTIDQQEGQNLTLVLDDIQDPGNLGTIIRTADWFGIHDIFCSKNTADCYNPKVVQATMGSLARVRMHYTDLQDWLKKQDTPIFGTLLEGENMYSYFSKMKENQEGFQQLTKGKSIIIMGNEGNGISTPIRKMITHPLRIPSYPSDADTAESLNVSIATAIILSEFRRLAR